MIQKHIGINIQLDTKCQICNTHGNNIYWLLSINNIVCEDCYNDIISNLEIDETMQNNQISLVENLLNHLINQLNLIDICSLLKSNI